MVIAFVKGPPHLRQRLRRPGDRKAQPDAYRKTDRRHARPVAFPIGSGPGSICFGNTRDTVIRRSSGDFAPHAADSRGMNGDRPGGYGAKLNPKRLRGEEPMRTPTTRR